MKAVSIITGLRPSSYINARVLHLFLSLRVMAARSWFIHHTVLSP